MENRKKQNGKMSDEVLSKQLGRCQDTVSFWILASIVGAVVGTVLLFAMESKLPATAVYLVCFGGAFIFGGGAQKKQKQLMQEQLGDFFAAEQEQAFGPELHTEVMRIDEAFLREAELSDVQWEKCSVESFREGLYRGIRFSAANTILYHVTRSEAGQEGVKIHEEPVFQGVVLRCETRCDAVDAGQTPEFRERIRELEALIGGKVAGLQWQGNVLSLALETRYRFAVVPDSVDLRDLAEVRRQYIATLEGMKQILTLLFKDTALFAAQED